MRRSSMAGTWRRRRFVRFDWTTSPARACGAPKKKVDHPVAEHRSSLARLPAARILVARERRTRARVSACVRERDDVTPIASEAATNTGPRARSLATLEVHG